MDTTDTRATYADVLAAPDTVIAELIDGTLFLTPRPAVRHAHSSSRLGVLLGPFDREAGGDDPGGWIILDEPELHFGAEPKVLVPDLAGWRRDRWPPQAIAMMHVTVAPDWICEVVSPSTERWDRAQKMDVYLMEGVRWAWLVNPVTETLEAYRGRPLHLPDKDAPYAWTLIGVWSGRDVARVEPFAALPIDLTRLWTP
jgi:Uma2 family endonuclease